MSQVEALPELLAEDPLRRFCAVESPTMERPWVKGGWRYYCDGRIAVRVPALGQADSVPEYPRYPFPAADVVFAAADWCGEFAQWPEDGWVDGKAACWECNETGIVGRQDCPRCKGDGQIHCPECGNDYECPSCDGDGLVGQGRPCAVCGGRGDVSGVGRRVGKHLIAVRYDRLVRSLPGVRYSVGVSNDERLSVPVPFLFDGGQGVVMGRSEPLDYELVQLPQRPAPPVKDSGRYAGGRKEDGREGGR